MREPRRRDVLAAGCFLLAGCSGSPIGSSDDGSGATIDERYVTWQYDWQNTGLASDVTGPTGEPDLLWERDIGPGNGGSRPVVADGNVFVGNGENTFFALDGETGGTNWTAGTGKWIHSTAAIDDDFLVFGCDDYVVRAYHLDGTERWTYTANFEVSADPVLTAERVIVTDTRSDVYALDRRMGEPVWTRTLETGALGYLSSPIVAENTIYVGNEETTWALSIHDGDTSWSTEDPRRVGGSHAVVDDTVVGVSTASFDGDHGTVYALDRSTGDVRWFHETDQRYPSDVAIANGTIYVSDPDGLAARSLADGTVQWRAPLGGASGTPVVTDGTVYCSSTSGVAAVDTDGSVRWQTAAASGDSGIAIASGTIFMKHAQTLFALR